MGDANISITEGSPEFQWATRLAVELVAARVHEQRQGPDAPLTRKALSNVMGELVEDNPDTHTLMSRVAHLLYSLGTIGCIGVFFAAGMDPSSERMELDDDQVALAMEVLARILQGG